MVTNSFTPTRNDSVTVTTTPSIVLKERVLENSRRVFYLRNMSTNAADIITINMGSGLAVAGSGVVLKQGEISADSSESGYECWQGNVSAVCATANGVLAIFER